MQLFIKIKENRTLIIVALILLTISCNNSKKDINDNLVFRYNEYKNISSLDPAFSKDKANIWACNQIFNGLVQLDDNLNIQPDIAENWIISDDAKTYTFTLREDVLFHPHEKLSSNERKVTAQDFTYSFKRLIDEKVASPGSWVLQQVEDFKAIDKHTFQITLKQPFPAFLGLLTMKYCSVVPKKIVDYYGNDFRANPIGTGPFYFKRW